MSSAETLFKEAFIRLKNNIPINMPKGTPVSQNNVAKEAGKHRTALKKDRFPLVVLAIQDYVDSQEVSAEVITKKKNLRRQRTTEDRLAACIKERDRLATICEALENGMVELLDELADYKRGASKVSPIRS